jgi:DNA ligase-associated metallophosphoesterase
MPNFIDFDLAHQNTTIPLRLYADGAMYWPAGQTLFITDPHFGKADSFRHAGIAIPTAILDHDLAKLDNLLAQNVVTRLVVLGDFFHTRHSQSDETLQSLHLWRSSHPQLEAIIVQGNHDLHAGPPPAEFDIATVEAPWQVGPFVCHHMPQNKASDQGYILAGHLHPYVVLYDRDRSRLRLASFIFSPHQAILPAFGHFTGGSVYAPAAKDRVFAIGQGEILEIPTAPRRASILRP